MSNVEQRMTTPAGRAAKGGDRRELICVAAARTRESIVVAWPEPRADGARVPCRPYPSMCYRSSRFLSASYAYAYAYAYAAGSAAVSLLTTCSRSRCAPTCFVFSQLLIPRNCRLVARRAAYDRTHWYGR